VFRVLTTFDPHFAISPWRELRGAAAIAGAPSCCHSPVQGEPLAGVAGQRGALRPDRRPRQPNGALVGVVLHPGNAGALVQAGKVQLDGDDTPLKELAALMDEFDPDFAIVTP
jgi:Alkyl sulfatase C-terminal